MKSIENKFAEAMVALKKAGKVSKFDEVSKTCTTIESKLVAAEQVLNDAGIVREAIRKHNGAGDNFVEGNPLGRTVEELRENSFSAGYVTETNNKEHVGKSGKSGDQILRESFGMPDPGAKPSGYEALTEGQRKEFDFARLIGISEADCFTLVKMTGGYKQVSR